LNTGLNLLSATANTNLNNLSNLNVNGVGGGNSVVGGESQKKNVESATKSIFYRIFFCIENSKLNRTDYFSTSMPSIAYFIYLYSAYFSPN
jgi:hypothetical protein